MHCAGYTRNFTGASPAPVRRNPGLDSSIPKKPDELLSSLGQEVDTREMQRITQVPTLLSCRNSLVLICLVIMRSFVMQRR